MSSNRSDSEVLGEALNDLKGFAYVNSAELTLVSVLWFVCSLPVVTIGPVTLGAYTAVTSLHEEEGLNASRVFGTVRDNLVGSTLLGLLPIALGGITFLYLYRFLTAGDAIAGLLTLVGVYATIFVGLVLIPTFVSLAQGASGVQALRQGYLWVVLHPTLALAVALFSTIFLGVTAILVVAFMVLFAGVTFSFHVEVMASQLEEIEPDER